MALINRITGQSLEQEMEQNRLTAEQTGSEPQTNPAIPPHTALFLIEQAGKQIDSLTTLIGQLEELTEKRTNQSAQDRDVEPVTDEMISDLGRRFDEQCNRIVKQRLSDAQKQGERLANRLERAARQATGIRRLLLALLILSGLSLTALIFTGILLLTKI